LVGNNRIDPRWLAITAWTVDSPMSVPPVSRRAVKKASNISPGSLPISGRCHWIMTAGSASDGFEPDAFSLVTDGVVGQVRQHDQGFFAGHADRSTGGIDRTCRKTALQSADHLRQGMLVLRCGLGARQFAQSLGHGFEAPGVTQNVRYEAAPYG
jgi:hypothetical protein